MKQLAAAHSGEKVLLPALCCESMILPFQQNGCKVDFYRLRSDLTGDEEDVLKKLSPGCILLYMTYFDVRPFSDALLEKLRTRKVFLLEDRTQDIIVPRRGGFQPEAMIASLRKWAAMPEGGLAEDRALPLPEAPADSRFARLRLEAMEEKGEYLEKGLPEMKADFLKKLHEADELLDESGQARRHDSVRTCGYIEELDFEKILCNTAAATAAILGRELADCRQRTGKLRFMGRSGKHCRAVSGACCWKIGMRCRSTWLRGAYTARSSGQFRRKPRECAKTANMWRGICWPCPVTRDMAKRIWNILPQF